MTKKEDFQRELKEKVKEGVKPSQLKRSKSVDDLPKQSDHPTSLTNCEKELKQAKIQIQQLTEQITRIKAETNEQLKSLPTLKEELKEKDNKIKELNAELEKSLEARLKNLKTPNNHEEINKFQTELKQAKNKISLLESTLRLQRYNNSWLDSETWTLVISFLVVGGLFWYSTKPHDQKN